MGSIPTVIHKKKNFNTEMKIYSDLKSLPPNLRSLIRKNHVYEHVSSKKVKVTQQKITADLKMCHTSLKSLKHETFLKLSKLFSKTPVSISTTKHTISSTPAMRLVAHNQGSSLSHAEIRPWID